jgi:hypothetical protein
MSTRAVARQVWNELSDRIRVEFKEEGFKFADFTCATCELVAKCEHAFDAYNTDGDCLVEK